MKTFVIAEPGCTPEGQFDAMKELIVIAATAGCDGFKNQWTSHAARMVERRNAPSYASFYRWLEYPHGWHVRLAQICHDAGIQYGCSVYLPEDVPLIAPFVDFLKVSSFEAEDEALMESCARSWRRTIVSLGMGGAKSKWAIGMQSLHCTSAYPAPLESLNLARLYNVEGLSDHSAPEFTWIGALAVAAGAEIIETHIRSEHCRSENPDFAVARNPRQLADYVRHIRFAETALGTRQAGAHPVEVEMQQFRVRA